MTKSRGINRPKHNWTPEQLAILAARYPHEKTKGIAVDLGISLHVVFRMARKLGLAKTDEYLASADSGRLRGLEEGGKAFRFPKGHVPANKGKSMPIVGRMAETQFKKREPHESRNYVPIGTLKVDPKDGYLMRKFTDDRSLAPVRRWAFVHREVWIAANGPVPPGHVVAFKPGMKTAVEAEITIDKLELVSKADMCRRNSIHNYPPELADLMRLRGALTRQINKRSKTHE